MQADDMRGLPSKVGIAMCGVFVRLQRGRMLSQEDARVRAVATRSARTFAAAAARARNDFHKANDALAITTLKRM